MELKTRDGCTDGDIQKLRNVFCCSYRTRMHGFPGFALVSYLSVHGYKLKTLFNELKNIFDDDHRGEEQNLIFLNFCSRFFNFT